MTILEKLQNKDEIKAELQRLKLDENYPEFEREFKADPDAFASYLDDEDPKVRRLMATLISKTEDDTYLERLVHMYLNEPQRMICDTLAKNLAHFDLEPYLDLLTNRQHQLEDELNGEMSKHARAELRVLRQVLNPYVLLKAHEFTGFKTPVTMVLTVPSGHQEALLDELNGFETKKVALGVQVKTNDLNALFKSHLFSNIYFPLCKVENMEVATLASVEVASKIVRFLDRCHKGEGSYRYHIDMEDGTQARKVAEALEANSEKKLSNFPSDYEFEIRIRENKEGSGLVYLKLMSIPDTRFSYKKHISSSSMSSHMAALMVHYLMDYVPFDGQLLDPMCNDATLLIERCYCDMPHFAMGLDMNDDLMRMAKGNLNNTSYDVRLVQRDIASFTHKRKFNEVITKLPSLIHENERESLENIYRTFFGKLKELCEEGAIVGICSSEVDLVNEMYRKRKKFLDLKKKIALTKTMCLFIFEVKASEL